MRLQVKVLWVGAPTRNDSAQGTFFNQDVVAQDLNSTETFVLRVTSGPNAKNISEFRIVQNDVFECNGYFRASFGRETERPFMQFTCTAVERDRSKWGTTGGGNSTLDFSNLPPSYNAYGSQTPAAPQKQAPQSSAPAQPQSAQQPPLQQTQSSGDLPF